MSMFLTELLANPHIIINEYLQSYNMVLKNVDIRISAIWWIPERTVTNLARTQRSVTVAHSTSGDTGTNHIMCIRENLHKRRAWYNTVNAALNSVIIVIRCSGQLQTS